MAEQVIQLTEFSIEVKWLEGKMHMIADALSRALVFQPQEEEEETHETAIHCLQMRETNELTDIAEAIRKHYNAIVQLQAATRPPPRT